MGKHLLPAAVLPSLIEMALKSRMNIESLMSDAGIDLSLIGRVDAFVPISQLDEVFSKVIEGADDPFLGIHVGESYQYSMLDLLGNLVATSETIEAAITQLIQYKNLVVPYLDLRLLNANVEVGLQAIPDGSTRFAQTRTYNELFCAITYTIASSLLNRPMRLVCIEFMHAKPDDISEYLRVFNNAPLVFNAKANKVVVEKSELSERLSSAYGEYNERVEQLAQQQLKSISRGHSMADQVREIMQSRIGHHSIGIDGIADVLNMTPRTLQRKLKQENTAFVGIREELRHELACEALAQASVDIEQLAESLGFSDTSNFYHAFKRWEGCSPGMYRKLVLQQS